MRIFETAQRASNDGECLQNCVSRFLNTKVIVAINEAAGKPILRVAVCGRVADFYQAVPKLTAELGKVGN